MKRIEFIAPVEAMRGNLSGSQDLNYGANNGRAYDQEVGKQTAANNYDPRFVGAKRGRDGLKYFQVRTKNSVGLSVKSKTAMALLAGSSACFVAASKNVSILTRLQVAFDAAKASDASLTFRKWLQGLMFEMLALKQKTITIPSAIGDATICNPWVMDGDGVHLTIASKILIKFASILAEPQPIPVNLGQFGSVLLRWDGANPNCRNSLIWGSKNIPEEFNPDLQGPFSGHHFILQADLMDGNKMLLQEKNGDTTLNTWRIKDGETSVTSVTNIIPNHDYILEPYS